MAVTSTAVHRSVWMDGNPEETMTRCFLWCQSFVIYSLRQAKSALRFSLQGRLHQSGWSEEPLWERMSVTGRASVACGDVTPSSIHLSPCLQRHCWPLQQKPAWEGKAVFSGARVPAHHCLSLWDDIVKTFRHNDSLLSSRKCPLNRRPWCHLIGFSLVETFPSEGWRESKTRCHLPCWSITTPGLCLTRRDWLHLQVKPGSKTPDDFL